ncbi:MAG: stalk domain-containing protein [Clostridiales bacterium]|nr:stalk domain-containing protein [Clostridiales bacterium]
MKKSLIALLLAFLLLSAIALSVHAVVPINEIALTIRGDGVEGELSFTLTELKAMTANTSRNAYSTWNTWPARSVHYAEGVALAELLRRAGLKETAATVNIAEAQAANGSAGYNQTFLLDDLLAERFTFEGGKKAVPAILAWKQGDKGFSMMDDTDLRLIYGQLDEQEQTSAGFVKNTRIVTVSCDKPKRLALPQAIAEKQADGRYTVTLASSNVNAKVYYTIDGSVPTVHSKMYNVSAPHWQPQLNEAFVVSSGAVVKALAVATGFADSEILEFIPDTPPAPATPPEPAPQPEPASQPAALSDKGSILVFIDGDPLAFDVPPQNINGRILVPLRAIFEALGAVIEYDGAARTVRASKGSDVVVLTIDDPIPTVNGVPWPLDQPGILFENRTLAPLRFVSEAFGGKVDWDSSANAAYITK